MIAPIIFPAISEKKKYFPSTFPIFVDFVVVKRDDTKFLFWSEYEIKEEKKKINISMIKKIRECRDKDYYPKHNTSVLKMIDGKKIYVLGTPQEIEGLIKKTYKEFAKTMSNSL